MLKLNLAKVWELSSMRERVQALRGKLNISSSSSGTRVEACVPLADTKVLLVENLAPDVVVMDLMMPEMNGVEATRLLKQHSPRSQFIVLTSYHDDEHIFPAIRAGALSYLLKGVSLDELTEAVRKAANGEAVLHAHVATRLVEELHGAPKANELLYKSLSQREREVLHFIADGKSNAQIAESLFISERTVKSHVNNILSKLHVADRTQAAIFAWREGIMDR